MNLISSLQISLKESVENLVCLGINLNNKKTEMFLFDNQTEGT